MDVKELKKLIKNLPDNMPIQFCTSGMWMVSDVGFEVYTEDMFSHEKYVDEPTLIISAAGIS